MDKIRVLILEDDNDIIDLVRSVLEPDYECVVAGNGMEGLQMVRHAEPDLAVCDIMMPVMDGHEFIKTVRKQPGHENLPVVFLSALNSRDQIREGYELGASLYLTKPIDPARFKRNIELFVCDHEIHPVPKARSIGEIESTGASEEMLRAGAESRHATPPPAPKPAAAKKPAAKTRQWWMPQGDIERPRILVVDDDRDTCQMAQAALDKKYEVLVAKDGVAAIERAVRYKPDLFIVDGVLPRMTGYQLTMMLRKNRDFFRTPIIFISGKASSRDKQYVARLGVNQFLPKPFEAKQLVDAVEAITNSPGFEIHKNRIRYDQFFLENFQRIETHRDKDEMPVEREERPVRYEHLFGKDREK